MRRKSDTAVYAVCVVLFTVSFGFFVLDRLYWFSAWSGYDLSLPDALWTQALNNLESFLFFDVTRLLPLGLNFFCTVVLSFVLLFRFMGRFRSEAMLHILAAPLVLMLTYGISFIEGICIDSLPILDVWLFDINALISAIPFALLIAYAVGFYRLMHREWEYLQMQAASESAQ